MPLLLLFVITPVLEMWLLIEVGGRIGAPLTIGLVLLTAMVGLALLKRQGFSTLTRANQRMEQGQIPAEEMITGLFLAIGGALLLTPGFVTDAIGFACLLPGIRELLMGKLIKKMLSQGQFQSSFHFRSYNADGSMTDVDGEIIEGEFTRADRPELEVQDKKPEDTQ